MKRIVVFENQRIDVEFYYMNQYRIMQEVNKKIDEKKAKERLTERSA